MDYGDEKLLIGWQAIAGLFQMPMRTMMDRRKELVACGAVFYRRKRVKNHSIKIVCAFPSQLKMWAARKTIKGEKI